MPGSVEIRFNFRFSTASTPEGLQQRLCAILDKHGLDYAIDWTLGARPFLTSRGPLADAAAAAIQEICGIDTELSTTGGTSDGRFIAEICPQVLEIGPVNATIHKIDECVDVAALPRLSAIYRRILKGSWRHERFRRPRRTGHRARLPAPCRQPLHRSGLFFGHGSDNAWDEAVYLTLHTLNLPLDRLEPFFDARLLPHKRAALLEVTAVAARTACPPPT